MSQEKANIDVAFKEGLKSHRTVAPTATWSAIESSLNNKKSRFIPLWMRWSAAAAVVIFAFISGYYLATKNNSDNQYLVKEDKPDRRIIKIEGKNQQRNQNIEHSRTMQAEGSNEKMWVENDQKVLHDEIIDNQAPGLTEPETFVEFIADQAQDRRRQFLSQMTQLNPKAIAKNGFFSEKIKETDHSIALILLKGNMDHTDEFLVDSDTENKQQKSKWSLLANLAPSYSYRDLQSTGSFAQDNALYSNNISNNEVGLLSYAGQINLSYEINNKLAFETGLGYSQMGQATYNAFHFVNMDKEWVVNSCNTSIGSLRIDQSNRINTLTEGKDDVFYSDSSSIVSSSFNQVVDLLEIPLNVKLKLIDKRANVSIRGGLNPSIMIRNQSYMEISGSKYQLDYDGYYRQAVLLSMLSLDMEYEISRRFTFNMAPTFKYSLTTINKNSDLKNRPYAIGWFTGIRYKL